MKFAQEGVQGISRGEKAHHIRSVKYRTAILQLLWWNFGELTPTSEEAERGRWVSEIANQRKHILSEIGPATPFFEIPEMVIGDGTIGMTSSSVDGPIWNTECFVSKVMDKLSPSKGKE